MKLEELQTFVQQLYSDTTITLTPFGTGAWSYAFLFATQKKKYVIRTSNILENFEKDELAYSYNCLTLRIPKMVRLGSVSGRYYAISKYVHGSYFEKQNANCLNTLLPSLKDMLSALYKVDLSQTTGYGNWTKPGIANHKSWHTYLLDVVNDPKHMLITGWKKNLENSVVGTKSFTALYKRLEQYVHFCPNIRHLIHSDLLNFNVLVQHGAISAVLDWGSSKYGDPLYDLAWFLYYEPWYPEFTKIKLCEELITHFKFIIKDTENFEGRLLCYKLHIGLESIAYNAYKKQWKEAEKAAEYTAHICI